LQGWKSDEWFRRSFFRLTTNREIGGTPADRTGLSAPASGWPENRKKCADTVERQQHAPRTVKASFKGHIGVLDAQSAIAGPFSTGWKSGKSPG
jgi:hypothetical protein